jgi:hypothetical protein
MSLEELQDSNYATRGCVIRSVFIFLLVVFQGSNEYGVEMGYTRCGDSLRHSDAAATAKKLGDLFSDR